MQVRFVRRGHPSRSGEYLQLRKKARGLYTFDMLADDISHSCSLTRADVAACIEALLTHTRQRLLDGYNVSFGNFGTFGIYLDAHMIPAGTMAINQLSAKTLIKDYKIRFVPHMKLRKTVRSKAEICLIP